MALTITDLTDYFDNVPSIQDPTNFEAYAGENMTDLANVFASGGDIHTFISETNALAAEAETNADDAETAQIAAEAAQTAAESASTAAAWSSVTTYAAGTVVYGTDFLSYRSAQAANTNHNPVGDGGTWWTLITGYIAGTAISMADAVLSRPKLIDVSETVNALGDLAGGTDDIDLVSGNVVTATVSTGTETFTFSNPPATGSNGSFTLILTNGGSQTINWPGSVDWPSATAPTLTAAGVDVLVFTTNDAGTIWLGFLVGLDVS